ncbi:hypothetical protein DV738_g4702, partial [Chaetothyriales sp. CBS 135597]
MLVPYGIVLPAQLPPPAEVSMSYDGPLKAMHLGDIHPPQPATQQDAALPEHGSHHGHRHLHLDFSKILHLPSFSGFHPAKPTHVTPSHHHWPSISYPPWPHFLAHSSPFHMTQLTPWVPPADVRQTPDCYLIDIDVPGLSQGDEEKVLVQWLSPRTIIVSAEIKKAAEPQLFKIPPVAVDSKLGSDIVDVSKSDAGDGGPLHRTRSHSNDPPAGTRETDQAKEEEIFLAHERHDGYWRRSFTLPDEVNFNPDPKSSSV